MKVPGHIAIIMDGNRRWAERRQVPHIAGHSEGVKSLDIVTEECARLGVSALTVYGFSIENWNRPKSAVDSLFSLFRRTLRNYLSKTKDNNLRFAAIGRISELPADLRSLIEKAVKETASNTGMLINVALNYGGRQEIVDAVRLIVEDAARGRRTASSIIEKDIEEKLYTSGFPEVDLVIRTSGEYRISNFLLWQSAYSEFYFTETLWPDFGKIELGKALEEYGRRQRRYGS